MRKFLLLLLVCLLGCAKTNQSESNTISIENTVYPPTTNTTTDKAKTALKYGAFLGASGEDIDKICQYDIVSVEFDEFDNEDISKMKNKDMQIFAYLNVGALESYREYYHAFQNNIFKSYENWPDEGWMDVTIVEWQTQMKKVAEGFKEKGADGVYMDNIDVYSIAKEHYENNDKTQAFYNSLKKIIDDVQSCGLKILMNGGSEFLEEAIDNNDNIVDKIYAYHQEEVFSVIDDYENDVFSAQDIEDSCYYQEIINKAYQKGLEIYLLEYTLDEEIIKKVIEYCGDKFYYYCANSIALK